MSFRKLKHCSVKNSHTNATSAGILPLMTCKPNGAETLPICLHYNKDNTSALTLQFIFNTSALALLALGWGISIAGALSIYCWFGLLELKRDRCVLLEELVECLHCSIRVNSDLKKWNKEKKMCYGLHRKYGLKAVLKMITYKILNEWKANVMYYLQDQSSCSLPGKRGLLGNHQPETLKDENFILRIMWRSEKWELPSKMHTKDTVWTMK